MRLPSPVLTLIRCAAVLPCALWPLAGLASPIEGEWDVSYEACMDEASDSRFSLSGGTMGFSEGICGLSNETAVPGIANAWVYDLTCDNDNEVTTEKALFAVTLGGAQLTIIGEDSAYTSERCP